jgi:hypothetical protein
LIPRKAKHRPLYKVQAGPESSQPPIKEILGAISAEVKRPKREVDDLPPSSVEVEKSRAITPLLHMSSWASAQLIKQRDNFAAFPCNFFPAEAEN